MADITPKNAGNQSVELIASQTAGATSEAFYVPEGTGYSVFCDALASGEIIGVEAQRPDGTWVNIKSDFLSSTSNEGAFYSKGLFRLVKSATASAVGVYSYNISFKRSGRG